MGISTVQSYRGAQIFEAIGLNHDVIDRYFTWTASRIEGIGLDVIARECAAAPPRTPSRCRRRSTATSTSAASTSGARRGEYHLYNPETHRQAAARRAHAAATRSSSSTAALLNDQSSKLSTLRGLLRVQAGQADPARGGRAGERDRQALQDRRDVARLDQPRGAREPGHRHEPHRRQVATPARAARIRCASRRTPNGDLRRSAIKQVASGRFGVTSDYLVNADELQIKMAQGAKPGEGGQLPGHKVDEYIAKIRYSTPGVGLISPPPHHDIYSIEDLAQLIHDLKNANDRARISVKLVAEVGVGTVAAGVAKAQGRRRPDQRPRRRHRRLAAHLDQARRHALGARPGRDAAGAGDERPARPHPRRDRRPAQDRPRRGHRGAARRRGVRLRHRARWSRRAAS